MLATQSCMRPEEGDVDTLYVYRKDTVYRRDTLVAKAAVETLSIDLFTYLYKYKYGYTFKDSTAYMTEGAKSRLLNLDDKVIPGDSLRDPTIIYRPIPKAYYAQIRIDTFSSWDGMSCSTFVTDSMQAIPDSVKWYRNRSTMDTAGAIAHFSSKRKFEWKFEAANDKIVYESLYRITDFSVLKPDLKRPGELSVPMVYHVDGNGFIVSDDFSRYYAFEPLYGRIIIVIQR